MKTTNLFFLTAVMLLCMSASCQVINGTFAIKNVETGMLLRIKDANKSEGTPLVSYPPVNWKCVTWDFNHIEGETYQLKNLFTGKTFQSKNDKAADGDAMQQQVLVNNRDNQQYEFIEVSKNVYLIKLKGTELYLTPSDSKGTTNSPVILTRKTGKKLQQWTLYEQHPDI